MRRCVVIGITYKKRIKLMLPPTKIKGITCILRLVDFTDVEFLFGLRSDPVLSRYISPVTGQVEDQVSWIASYKAREAAKTEAYYIIETLDGCAFGTVRLYDIKLGEFTWGSFILTDVKPGKAALDVAVHSLEIGFSTFGCNCAKLDAKSQNKHALSFYDRFGMTRYGEKDGSVLMHYDRIKFDANRERLLEIIQNAHT